MIIQLHTPQGIIEIDTETVSDIELAKLNISRESLSELLPRDVSKELDSLKAWAKTKGYVEDAQ